MTCSYLLFVLITAFDFYYTRVGASQCLANVCPVSAVNKTSWTAPQLCPSFSNTYVAGASSVLNCSCVPGYYSSNGSPYACTACPPGSFANGTGSFSCTACNAGSFSAFSAASACASCPAGSFSAAGATACTANAGYYDLGKSLMAYYAFDAANMTADSAPNPLGSLTAITDAPTAIAGNWAGSSAASFNGNVLAMPSLYWPDSGAFSACVWFMPKTPIAAWENVIDIGRTSTRDSLIIRNSGSTTTLYVKWNDITTGSSSKTFSNYFTPDVWTHVCAITFSPSLSAIYLNGVSSGGSISGTMATGLLSGNTLGSFFGIMDEVRLYPRALSSEEVTAVYGYNSMITTAVMPVLCPAGTFSVPGSAACASCPAGSFSAAGASACTVNAGFYDLGRSLMAYYTFDAASMTADSAPVPLGALTASATAPTVGNGPWAGASAANFSQIGSSGYSSDFAAGQSFMIPNISINYTNFTACMWIAPTSNAGNGGSPGRVLDMTWSYALGRFAIFKANTGELYFGYPASACSSCMRNDNFAYASSSWLHVCAVLQDSAILRWCGNANCNPGYVPSSWTTPIVTNAANPYNYLARGSVTDATSTLWAGLMDEVRLYPRALSQAEVTAIYSYRGNMTTAVMPVLCPAGTFSGASNATACTSCQPGFYSDIGSTVCTGCSAGLFSGATSSSACTTCSGGSFSAANASFCSTCSAGAYSNSGSSGCSQCTANTFSVAGSAACASCATGSFSMGGATACTANAGYYDLGKSLMAYYTFDAANMKADSAPVPLGSLIEQGGVSPTATTGPWQGSSAANFAQVNASGTADWTNSQSYRMPTVPASAGISFCAWYRPTNIIAYDTIIELSNACNKNQVALIHGAAATSIISTGNIKDGNSAALGTMASQSISNGFVLQQWAHACVVVSGTTGSIYLNGTSNSFALSAAFPIVNRSVPYIARSSCIASGLFSGDLDEIRVYPRALTQAEVTGIYTYKGSMTTAVMPIPCPAGSFSAANASSSCTVCAAGSFAGQTGQSLCTACDTTNYCPSGSSTPVTCAVGSYCPNASVQLPCDLGNYCPLGSTTQNACKAGSFCSNPTSQTTCSAGYYCPSSTTTQKACRTCSPNARLVNSCPSNSSDDVMSCTCNAGYYGDGFGCSACEANYWCVGGSARSQCPSNTNGPPQSSEQNGCVCNAGFYWVGSVNGTSPCSLCQAGSYCAGGNTVPSIACPAHAESPPGSVTIAQCVCTAGYYPLNNDINQCTLCPPGAFCSSGNLSTCPANSSSFGQGSSSKSACTCNAGYYGDPSNAGCMRCPMNAYCEGGFSFKNCTANAVTADLGSINASACYCDRGLLGVNNTACSVCVAGQWCWTGMANQCPNNTMSQPRSTHISNCTCNVGYSGDKGGPVCDLCVAGKYSSANGSSICTSCVAGTYSTAIRSISASTCTNCSIGTFNAQPAGNSSGACIACAAGSYSHIEGASACSRCKRGFYMPLQGSTGCIPCPWRTQTLDNSSQNSEGTCLCLPSWNCTYTRRARTQLQLSVNVNLDNLTRTLDAWAQIHAVDYNVNLV